MPEKCPAKSGKNPGEKRRRNRGKNRPEFPAKMATKMAMISGRKLPGCSAGSGLFLIDRIQPNPLTQPNPTQWRFRVSGMPRYDRIVAFVTFTRSAPLCPFRPHPDRAEWVRIGHLPCPSAYGRASGHCQRRHQRPRPSYPRVPGQLIGRGRAGEGRCVPDTVPE